MKIFQGKNKQIMHLKKGDIVDVISPASSFSKVEMREIAKFLEKSGLKARFLMEKELLLSKKAKNLFPQFSVQKRFEQLKKALKSDSKAIWCARGGYGSVDLIPFLQKSEKIAQNKLFIGFSDITTLGIFLEQNWNWKIIYGPMLTQLSFSKVSKKSEDAIIKMIFDKNSAQQSYDILALNKAQKIEGILVGGCLSVLCASLATANQIDFNDKILFLEDIDESGEKIDRYLTQILQFMVEKNCSPRAILFGNFYENVKEKSKKENIKLAIKNFAERIALIDKKIAVFEEKTGSLGHSPNIMPVVIGGKIEIIGQKIKLV